MAASASEGKDLIVGFPTERVRSRSRSVHFAETSETKYIKRLTDYEDTKKVSIVMSSGTPRSNMAI